MHFIRITLPLTALLLAAPVHAQTPPVAEAPRAETGCLRNIGHVPRLLDILRPIRGGISVIYSSPPLHAPPTCPFPDEPGRVFDIENTNVENADAENVCRAIAYNNRSAAHLAAGDADRAIADLRRAIALDQIRPDHYYANLGWALASKGSQAEALAAFDQAVRLNPTQSRPWVERAHFLWQKTTRYDLAFTDLNTVITLVRNDWFYVTERTEILYERALLRLIAGYVGPANNAIAPCLSVPLISPRADLQAGIADLDRIISLHADRPEYASPARDPNLARAHTLRGLVRLRQGEIALARTDLEKALFLAVEEDRDRELANSVQAMLDWFSAPDAAPMLEGDDPVWRICLDRSEVTVEDRMAACTQAAENAGQQTPRLRARARALVARSYIHVIQDDRDKAHADLSAAIAADPTYEFAYILRFMVFMKQLEARLESGAELPRITPAPARILCCDFGQSGIELDDFLGRLDAAISMRHYTPGPDLLRSNVSLDAGLPDLDAALRLDPYNPRTLALRAIVLARRGDVERARADIDHAAVLAPNAPFIRLVHAQLH